MDVRETLRSARKVKVTVELTGRQAAALLWWQQFQLRRAALRGSTLTPGMRAVDKITQALLDEAGRIAAERARKAGEAE